MGFLLLLKNVFMKAEKSHTMVRDMTNTSILPQGSGERAHGNKQNSDQLVNICLTKQK